MYNDPVFPPNRKEIVARLTEPTYLELLDVWTCDQAAQFLTVIDGGAFNQADVDDFEFFASATHAAAIANTIQSVQSEGKLYLFPMSVMEWAKKKGYELDPYILAWYEDQTNNKSMQPTIKSERELKQGLRTIWEKEGSLEMKFFFPVLKKYVDKSGSPIIDHFSAGKQAGIKYRTSSGTEGVITKKTISNYVSQFKKSQ